MHTFLLFQIFLLYQMLLLLQAIYHESSCSTLCCVLTSSREITIHTGQFAILNFKVVHFLHSCLVTNRIKKLNPAGPNLTRPLYASFQGTNVESFY